MESLACNNPNVRVLSTFVYTAIVANPGRTSCGIPIKVDIFDSDLLLVPINEYNHWMIAVSSTWKSVAVGILCTKVIPIVVIVLVDILYISTV